MHILLFLLALVATGFWALGYVYIHAMACAFMTNLPPGGCPVDWPWEQRGEDLIYLVLIPGAVVTGFWVAFFKARQRRQVRE
jgi:hypothetical protein